MTGSSHTDHNCDRAAGQTSAFWGPVRGAAWFIRTRPWLTGSAVLCTLILGLVVMAQPGVSKVADIFDDEGDFALLDEVGVFGAIKKPGDRLRLTSEPDLLSPGQDVGPFGASQSGTVIPAGFTEDPLSQPITVIRPDRPSPAMQGGQAAWLTGTIEEEAPSRYTSAGRNRHASR